MAKYVVDLTATCTLTYVVEAEDESSARDAAEREAEGYLPDSLVLGEVISAVVTLDVENNDARCNADPN